LKKYLNDNITEYVSKVFLEIEENKEESENSVKELLNNNSLKESLKEKLIKKVKCKIQSLKTIENVAVKELLINNSKIQSNWENVYDYYAIKENIIDNNLVDFLNQESNYTVLKSQKLSSKVIPEKENLEGFTKKVLLCNELSYESYKSLASSTIYKWNSLDFGKLASKKIELLIQSKVINCTKYFYDKLKADFPNLHIKLIENNFNSFWKSFDEYEKEESDILLLFKSGLSNQEKVKIFEKAPKSITINNTEIMSVFTEIAAEINYNSLNFDTLESIFKNSTSVKNRIKILNANFDKLDKIEIKSLIDNLPHKYRSLLKKQHKPKLPNTKENLELLDKLKGNGQIIRYEFVKDGKEIKAIANYT